MIFTFLFPLALVETFSTATYVPSSWNPNLEHVLQPHEKAFVAYEVIGEDMIVSMAVNAMGWVAFGPSESGSMIGGSMCVVMQIEGDIHAISYSSKSATTPTRNTINNCELIDFQQLSDTQETYATFKRPLTGCKPQELDIIEEWDYQFILAFGPSLTQFSYHGSTARTTMKMNPFYPPRELPPLPDDTQSLRVLVDDWPLGTARTLYYCKGHILPNDQRYHVIRFEGILGYVGDAYHHHLDLFECPAKILPLLFQDNNTHDCIDPNVYIDECSHYWMGWQTGQQVIDLRPAGYAIGAGSDPVAVAVVVVSHIDHPSQQNGTMVEEWGLLLYYTPTLQAQEGQMFSFNVGFYNGIPPGMAEYEFRGEIPTNILDMYIPQDGLVISGIGAHAHGLQSRWKMTVVRDGVERPDLSAFSNSWDYNMQDFRMRSYNHELRLLRGDRVLYSCYFNTTTMTEPVYWGEGFLDEMCVLWVQSYPQFDNAMNYCMVDGRTFNVDAPDQDPNDVLVALCDGNGVRTGLLFSNNTWETPPSPPNNCEEMSQ